MIRKIKSIANQLLRQRLLFRVLHGLSLYFPDVGYVQGMASLAATLLCYYDEDNCFVMLVRLWKLRGLERLYGLGFGGLMGALDELEKKWLTGRDVTKKLVRHDYLSCQEA
jgi:Rab-GTPase-TBC domain